MLVEASVQAGRAELRQIIERRIVERTWRRIRQLRVEVCGGRVVVYGRTPRYYAKQLAILAVLDALREAGVTAVLDMRINVSPRPIATINLPAHDPSLRPPEKAACCQTTLSSSVT